MSRRNEGMAAAVRGLLFARRMQTDSNRRARRPVARGVTLVEVLIVVSIMTLIATAATVAILPQWERGRISMATTNATALRQQAETWRVRFDARECPTFARLVADKVTDAATRPDDPWGTPFAITCEDDAITVTSAGPDRRQGTVDDISIPPPTTTAAR